MALDPESIAALREIIDKEGESVTFIDPNRSDGSNEWEVTDGADVETTGKAYIAPVENRRADGETIRITDSVAYVYAPDGPSNFSDEFRIRRQNGDEYQVVDIVSYDLGGVPQILDIVIRT